jgi:GH24 family phage-related lysozyme (muramidase)
MALTTSELEKSRSGNTKGLRLTAYDDGAGNLTIGYGHKVVSDLPNQITRETGGGSCSALTW